MKDLSVILSTHNRGDLLRKTLAAMCELERDGLEVEFVVVDNNSTDDTAQAIESYANRLPLRHLFEARPGKNCALNHALDTIDLGGIVVFTDDDVVPHRDWLMRIDDACQRWPEYDAFGGRIELIWPQGAVIPEWASGDEAIRGIGFAEHDLGAECRPYRHDSVPSGPNFWVRGKVLAEGVRCDESMWTRPGRQFCMGDEKEFLLRLATEGAKLLYVPEATVGHHVQQSLLTPRNMLRRAVRYGRGAPHLRGLPDAQQLEETPWRWRGRRLVAASWYLVRFLRARLCRDECIRMRRAAQALRNYGYHRESLAMSWRPSESGPPQPKSTRPGLSGQEKNAP